MNKEKISATGNYSVKYQQLLNMSDKPMEEFFEMLLRLIAKLDCEQRSVRVKHGLLSRKLESKQG